MKRFPNRFSKLGYVNVNALRVSFLAGCIFNLVVLGVIAVVVLFIFFFSPLGAVSSSPVVIITVPPVAVVLPTVPFAPTVTPFPSLVPAATFTPFPTSTPLPSSTPFPTLAPLPTSTPFTLTVLLAVPSSTPTRLYNLPELLAGAPLPLVLSEYKYGFYRAVCLDGEGRIEPRVLGLPEIVRGLHWRLWNDFGFVLDTSEYEESYSDGTALFLSSDPALFHLGLFYYDQQISDGIEIDYPGSCPALQIIYVRAARAGPASAGNVWLPGPNGSVAITNTEVLSNVSVSR